MPPSYPQTLWSSVSIGFTGLDHVVGQDEGGAVIKALLLLLFFPLLPFIYLADVWSLAFRGVFFTQPINAFNWRDTGPRWRTVYSRDRWASAGMSLVLAVGMAYLLVMAYRSMFQTAVVESTP